MNPVDWALRQDVSATKKLLLVAIAWVADEDGVTIKSQPTIAARMGKDPRWVREHLPTLAEEGLLTRYRRHRMNGSRTSDLTVLNVPRDEPIDLANYSGIVGDREPGDVEPTGGFSPGGLPADIRQPTGENPPGHTDQPVNKPANGKKKEAREDAFPDDLPDELHDVAIAAGRILKGAALERGQSRPVTRAAVGHAVLTFADRDHVVVARNVENWILHGKGRTQSCSDIVARYRRFLDGSDPRPGPPLPPSSHGAPNGAANASTGPATMQAMAERLRAEAAEIRARGDE